MAYAFVQDAQGMTTVSVSTLATSSITITAGHWLMAAVLLAAGKTITSIGDGLGDTFTNITNSGTLSFWACPSSVGGLGALTVNASGPTSTFAVYLAEFSGLGASMSSVFTFNNNATSSLTTRSFPITVAAQPAMVWSFLCDTSSDATAPVVNAPLNARITSLWTAASPFDLNGVGDFRVTSTGGQTPNFTVGNQFDNALGVALVVGEAGVSAPQASWVRRKGGRHWGQW